ncbi:MAG: sulfatase [Candidatus Aminicenantes bacterium]|nr:sulfatase [Candidatus Aminicenantes bacterium]
MPLLLAAMLLASCGKGKVPPAPQKPNVLLIAVDTLRADHLGCYGYAQATSPRLDAFARRSVFFEHAFCPIPKTSASFASMMTGLHPHVHKTKPNRGTLNEKYLTLAELLKVEGYETAAVVDNANVSSFFKFNQGFDSFTEVWNQVEDKSGSTAFITARVLEFLGRPRQRPFFMWVNYIEPHTPYMPPAGFVRDYPPGRDLRELENYILPKRVRAEIERNNVFHEGVYLARYDGAVRYVDSEIGRIIDVVFARGLDKDTVVIVIADHGEDLGERNYFFDHGALTFTAGARVPLIAHFPGRKAQRVRTPVSVMDVYPTILELLGKQPPYPLQGISLFAPRPGRLLHIVGIGSHAVVRDRQHFVSLSPRLSRKLKLAPLHFFDLFADPRETSNVYGRNAAAARAMDAQYDAFIDRFGDLFRAPTAGRQGALSEKEKKSLETLGYL